MINCDKIISKEGIYMASSERKIGLAHILFYVAGLLLVIKFIMQDVVLGGDNLALLIANVFILVLVIGFYCFFLFGMPGGRGTIVALAPSVLLVALYGSVRLSLPYNEVKEAVNYVNNIANMIWMFIVIVGFVLLFFRHKLLGYILAGASISYAAFVLVSYIVLLIISSVESSSFAFDAKEFVATLCLAGALACIAVGSYRISKRQSWTL